MLIDHEQRSTWTHVCLCVQDGLHNKLVFIYLCRKRAHSPGGADEVQNKTEMSAKKLINDAEKVVDEALEALVMTNPNVNIIENHRVIVRSDVENVKDKVAILCGGGEWHCHF